MGRFQACFPRTEPSFSLASRAEDAYHVRPFAFGSRTFNSNLNTESLTSSRALENRTANSVQPPTRRKCTMRKSLAVLTLAAMTLALCAASFAVSFEAVITNDDNPSANSGTMYLLNPATVNLTQKKVLSTGGTGLGYGFFAVNGSTVTQNARCIFITDPGSNDIAAFAAPNYTKTGNYSDPAFN